MTNSDQQNCCHSEWMNLQEQELSELLQALNVDSNGDENRNNLLNQLIEKTIEHFQDYIDKRARLAVHDGPPYFAPSWCSSLEGSMLWIAGCRPSMFIRHLHTLIGKDIESQLEDYLQGFGNGKLGDVSVMQMNLINDLQIKIIKEEDKLSVKLTSLQEDMVDQPIAIIANRASTHREANRDADEALDAHARAMVSLLEEADKLRLSSLKELISILSPLQAVEFLAASKKLHLCIREWGKRRDYLHGRTNI